MHILSIDILPELLPPGGWVPALHHILDPVKGDAEDAARAEIGLALAAGMAGDAEQALRLLGVAAKLVGDDDAEVLLLMRLNRAQALLAAGELGRAAAEAAAALKLARREKMEHAVALAQLGGALVHLARGRRNDARSSLADAVRGFARTGDALRQVQSHYLLGEIAYLGEDPIRAGSHYRDGLALARAAGAQPWIELLTLRFEHR